MTGSATRKPRPVDGEKGRNKNWPLPYREAPPCGRGASQATNELNIRQTKDIRQRPVGYRPFRLLLFESQGFDHLAHRFIMLSPES